MILRRLQLADCFDFMGKFDLETQVLSREFVLLEPVTKAVLPIEGEDIG